MKPQQTSNKQANWPKHTTSKQGVRCQGCSRLVHSLLVDITGVPYCHNCYKNNRRPNLPFLAFDNLPITAQESEKS